MKEIKTIVYNKKQLKITVVDVEENSKSFYLDNDDFTDIEKSKIATFVNEVLIKYKHKSEYTMSVGCSQLKNPDGERITLDYNEDSTIHTLIYLVNPEIPSTDKLKLRLLSENDKAIYLESKEIIINKSKEE